MQAFLARYYAASGYTVSPQPAPVSGDAGQLLGLYQATSLQYTGFAKLGGLFELVSVSRSSDGALLLKQAGSGWRRRVAVAPLVFMGLNGESVLVFGTDEEDRVTSLFLGNAPHVAFVKLRWYETPAFHLGLLTVCLLAFLSVLRHPSGAFRRRRWYHPPEPRLSRAARRLAVVVSGLGVCITLGVAAALVASDSILHGVPPLVYAGMAASSVLAVFTVGMVVLSVLSWRRGFWHNAGRLRYTAMTLAAVAFVWQLAHFNLLGFNL